MASKENSLVKFNPEEALPSNWESVLDSRLKRLHVNQLEPERKRSSNSLIIARWNPTQQMANVEQAKGTHLDTAGNAGRVFTLYPEEMTFLVDKGRLVLYLDEHNIPASLEECYRLMLDSGLTMDKYLIYSHLKTLGGIVFRHRLIQYDSENILSSNLGVIYDVWLPKTDHKWKRKNPGAPSFFVLLISYQGHLQSIKMLTEVATAIKSTRVPIKLATVTGGVVDFFDCLLPLSPRETSLTPQSGLKA